MTALLKLPIKFTCILILLVFSSLTYSERSDDELTAKIDEFVDNIMKCRNGVGTTLAVVKDGEPIQTKGYGIKNLESGEPVTANTLFNIASITKHFGTTLLGILLEEHGRYVLIIIYYQNGYTIILIKNIC